MRSTPLPGRRHYDRYVAFILDQPVPVDAERRGVVTTLINVSLLSALIIPLFFLEFIILGIWELVLPLACATMAMVGAPLVYRFTKSVFVARELFIVALFSFKAWECVVFNNVISPGSVWFIACPLIALMLGSLASGIAWMVVNIIALVALHFLLGNDAVFPGSGGIHMQFIYIFSLIGASLSISSFLLLVEHARRRTFERLRVANATINELAIRDALTGIYNRRHIVAEAGRAESGSKSFCVALLDLDHFKAINDTYGHAAGDEVLKAVAVTVQGEIRQGDCFGRYGGEEFLLLMFNTSLAGGHQFLERIRQRIESLDSACLSSDARVTVSAGIAEHRPGESFSETIGRADHALYIGKSTGRNCVVPESPGQDAPVPAVFA